MVPETKYVQTADGAHIAYQIFGDGPVDLACVVGAVYGTHWSWVPEGTNGWRSHQDNLDQVESSWGTEAFARSSLEAWAAPSIAADERAVRWFASFIRRSASPGAALAYAKMNTYRQ